MPEERGLYPKMRVRVQLAYFARLHGLSAPAAGAAADALIERLGLEERAGDRVETLSLGNQQRVQLAVALVHDPELLVLDEPFSGLDPVGVDVLSGVLQERADAGVPVVFSSHQLELVERLCEAVAIVNRGRVVATGPVDELRERGGARRPRPRAGGRRRRRRVARRRARRRPGRGGGARDARAAVRGRELRPPARRRPRGRHGHALLAGAPDAQRPLPLGGGGVTGRRAVALVARREVSERIFEKSFLIGLAVTLVIIALVAVLPSALGFGGDEEYTVGVADPAALPVAEAAAAQAGGFDAGAHRPPAAGRRAPTRRWRAATWTRS